MPSIFLTGLPLMQVDKSTRIWIALKIVKFETFCNSKKHLVGLVTHTLLILLLFKFVPEVFRFSSCLLAKIQVLCDFQFYRIKT